MGGLGTKALVGHEILLEVQCGYAGFDMDMNVPAHWQQLRLLCTIEIMNYILDALIKDGLVETICHTGSPNSPTLETVFYRRRCGGPEHNALLPTPQEVVEQQS